MRRHRADRRISGRRARMPLGWRSWPRSTARPPRIRGNAADSTTQIFSPYFFEPPGFLIFGGGSCSNAASAPRPRRSHVNASSPHARLSSATPWPTVNPVEPTFPPERVSGARAAMQVLPQRRLTVDRRLAVAEMAPRGPSKAYLRGVHAFQRHPGVILGKQFDENDDDDDGDDLRDVGVVARSPRGFRAA